MLKEYWTQEREELVIDSILFLEESCFQKYVIKNSSLALYALLEKKPLGSKDVIIVEVNGARVYIVKVQYCTHCLCR